MLKLFWYKGFFSLKVEIVQFPDGFHLNLLQSWRDFLRRSEYPSITSDAHFKAVVKKQEKQQIFPVDIEVTIACKLYFNERLKSVRYDLTLSLHSLTVNLKKKTE